MPLKAHALKLIDINTRLVTRINSIMEAGDLSEWMSSDGIALLNSTLARIEDRKLLLEQIINTSPSALTTDLSEEALEEQVESAEHLLFHLTGTLKLARERQEALSTR